MSFASTSRVVRSYSRSRRADAFAKATTAKQQAILAFMREFLAENDQMPPLAKIAEHFKWSSTNAAQQHLDALIRIGRLELNEVGKLRFKRTKTTNTTEGAA